MRAMPASTSPQARSSHRVAVITVSYGSGEALETFLDSLHQFHGDAFPVVVVDNKPDEENVRDLAERFGALYLPLPSNPGYGAGMNAGVSALRREDPEPFDAYYFCNPDVRFLDSSIGALAASLLDDPKAGSIGPLLRNDDGTVYPSARNIPSVGTGVGHALLSRVWPANPWSRAYKNASDHSVRRSSGWLSGAAVMVRRDVYEEVGGWDDAYFMHFEDIDLGWRIGNAGYANVFEPSVEVEHSGAHSTKKHATAVERAMTDSSVRFMGKRYSGWRRAPLRWMVTAGLRLRGMLRVRAAQRS